MLTAFFIVAGALTQVVNSNVLRVYQARSVNLFTMNVGNHFAAMILAGAMCLLGRGLQVTPAVLAVGGITGVFYAASIYPILLSMGQRGLAMTVAVTNVAQLIPCLVGIGLGEHPGRLQIAGMAVAAAAIPLVSLAAATGTAIRERPKIYMVLLVFVIQGAAMSGNLVAFNTLPAPAIPSYFVILYASGTVVSFLVFDLSRTRLTAGGFGPGCVFGVLNFLSTFTIVTALAYVAGCVFFAAMSVLGLVLSAALGAMAWRERIQLWGWAGLALAVVALVFLNLK